MTELDEETGKIDGKLYQQFMWGLLTKESELRGRRIAWFGTLQGFLWLSLAAILDNEWSATHGFWLIMIVAALGLAVSLAILCAGTAIPKIRNALKSAKENDFVNFQYVQVLQETNAWFEQTVVESLGQHQGLKSALKFYFV